IEAENRKRLTTAMVLLAEGRERQGRLVDAVRDYRELFDLAGDRELLDLRGEPGLAARADRWVPGRIAAVAARATAEQRRTLEDALAREGRALRDGGDLAALERFVALFGDHFAAGKEARLDLAERLGGELERGRFLEAELHLLRLCALQEEPARAGRAL